MSDTDDEGAFESADEGETGTPQHRSKKGKPSVSSEKATDSQKEKPTIAEDISDKVQNKSEPDSVETADTGEQHVAESEVDSVSGQVEQIEVSPKEAEETDTPEPESPVQTQPKSCDKPVETQSPQAATIERGNSSEEEKKISVLEKLSGAAADQKTGGWGWGGIGSWGSNVLSSATSGVTTFTSSVGEGLTQVMETVESSLGAPSAEEAAAMEEAEKIEKEMADKHLDVKGDGATELEVEEGEKKEHADGAEGGGEEAGWGGSWGGWGISGITSALKETVQQTAHVVQSTTDVVTERSQKIVSGSLNVLESIGKKTYDAIAEGDHGLKSTIHKAKDKPNLSLLLREAKEDAAKRVDLEEEFLEARKAHFGAQFDDFQGLAHLEALEMLSNQCEAKVQSLLSALPGEKVDKVKAELIALKTSFELEDLEDEEEDDDKDHDFDRLMADYIGQLGLKVSAEKMIHAQEKGRKLLMDLDADQKDDVGKSPKVVHENAIQSLAELTANSVGLFHKVGQLLLAEIAPLSSYKTKASSLANVTRTVCTEVGIISTKYTQQLNTAAEKTENPNEVNPLITNVYLEATNSSTYIQDAFQLVLPAMQQSALESFTSQES